MYETFFAEEPRAKKWVQRDLLGQPILRPTAISSRSATGPALRTRIISIT